MSHDAFSALSTLVGQQDTSHWLTMDQEHLSAFAMATYLEPDRVDLTPSKNNALGPTLVDGFLLLSLLVHFDFSQPLLRVESSYGLNYGLDRVRFTAPVFVGERVRLHRKVTEVARKSDTRSLVTLDTTMESDSGQTVMVARWLYLLIDGAVEKQAEQDA